MNEQFEDARQEAEQHIVAAEGHGKMGWHTLSNLGDAPAVLAEAMLLAAQSNFDLRERFGVRGNPEEYARLVNEESYEFCAELLQYRGYESLRELVDLMVVVAGAYFAIAAELGGDKERGFGIANEALRAAALETVEKNAAKTTETHTYNGKKIVRKD